MAKGFGFPQRQQFREQIRETSGTFKPGFPQRYYGDAYRNTEMPKGNVPAIKVEQTKEEKKATNTQSNFLKMISINVVQTNKILRENTKLLQSIEKNLLISQKYSERRIREAEIEKTLQESTFSTKEEEEEKKKSNFLKIAKKKIKIYLKYAGYGLLGAGAVGATGIAFMPQLLEGVTKIREIAEDLKNFGFEKTFQEYSEKIDKKLGEFQENVATKLENAVKESLDKIPETIIDGVEKISVASLGIGIAGLVIKYLKLSKIDRIYDKLDDILDMLDGDTDLLGKRKGKGARRFPKASRAPIPIPTAAVVAGVTIAVTTSIASLYGLDKSMKNVADKALIDLAKTGSANDIAIALNSGTENQKKYKLAIFENYAKQSSEFKIKLDAAKDIMKKGAPKVNKTEPKGKTDYSNEMEIIPGAPPPTKVTGTPLANSLSSPSPMKIKPNSNVEIAKKFFEERGYNEVESAAILGNLLQESSLNPKAYNKEENAKGIAQWKMRAEEFRKIYGKDVLDASLQEQLDFVDRELKSGQYDKALNVLKDPNATLEEKTAAIDRYYEISAQKHTRERIANARKVLSGNYEMTNQEALAGTEKYGKPLTETKQDESGLLDQFYSMIDPNYDKEKTNKVINSLLNFAGAAVPMSMFKNITKDPSYQYKSTIISDQALSNPMAETMSDMAQMIPTMIQSVASPSSGGSFAGSGALTVSDPNINGEDYQRAFGVMAA